MQGEDIVCAGVKAPEVCWWSLKGLAKQLSALRRSKTALEVAFQREQDKYIQIKYGFIQNIYTNSIDRVASLCYNIL
jgi:uncharacterized protein YdiU (UPF0061 family)